MHKYKYIIIDIETLSTRVNAAVFAVAAINHADIGFNHLVDLTDQEGRRDDDCIIWWLKTGAPWLAEAKDSDWLPPQQVEAALLSLYHETDPDHIWVRGPDFDIPRLAYLFGKEHDALPWPFNSVRDVRTAEMVVGTIPKNEHKHDPLEDCKHAQKIVDAFYEIVEEKGQ